MSGFKSCENVAVPYIAPGMPGETFGGRKVFGRDGVNEVGVISPGMGSVDLSPAAEYRDSTCTFQSG